MIRRYELRTTGNTKYEIIVYINNIFNNFYIFLNIIYTVHSVLKLSSTNIPQGFMIGKVEIDQEEKKKKDIFLHFFLQSDEPLDFIKIYKCVQKAQSV